MQEKTEPETTQADMVSENMGSVEPQKTRMKRWVKPLALTFLGILVAAGLFCSGYKFAQIRQSQVIPTIELPPSERTTETEKIYENSNMGIKFTYPTILVPNESSTNDSYTVFFYGEEDRKLRESGVIAEKPANMIAIHSFINRSYQEEIDRVLSNVSKNQKTSDITFKGYPTKEITGNLEQFGITLNSKHIVVNKNGIIYSLGVEWYSDTKIAGYFDQIIESFEFIK